MSVYAWCEDSGSGFTFWNEILKTLHPDIIVETKRNNTRLRQEASRIINDGNTYYILIDAFMDNADVLRELDGLKRGISGKENVFIVDIRSFEFVLLSFRLLEQWVFAQNDWLKDKRRELLQARKLFVELETVGGTDETLAELKELFPYMLNHSNEQVSAELLYQITRNTGFETSKGKLGECFLNDCCQWTFRQADDLCGLDEARPDADEKKKQIISNSVLKAAFEKAGL